MQTTAPGWTQVKGGHHFCALHLGMVTATVREPVWLHYFKPTVSDMTVCGDCAKEVGHGG